MKETDLTEAPVPWLIDVLVLLFTGSVYLSAFLINVAPRNTNKLTMFALFVVLYFVFRFIFYTFRNERRKIVTVFCVALILSGLVEAVWGLWQLYSFTISQRSLVKPTGSFSHPVLYGGYLSVIFPMALYYGLKKSLWIRIIAIGICAIILSMLFATMSWTVWPAVLAGSAVVVLSSKKIKFRANRRHLRSIAFATALLLITGLIGIYFLKKDSADSRFLSWKISLQIILYHPLGVGLGNFSGVYGETQIAYFASGRASETEALVSCNPEYGFNEYLKTSVESGILSLLLLIGILIQSFYLLRYNREWGIMGSLTALMVFAWFSAPFNLWPFLIVFFLLPAMSEIGGTQISADKKSKSASNYINIMLFLCLSVAVCSFHTQFPVYQANKKWNKAKVFYHSGMYEEVLKKYEPLHPYLNEQVQFLLEYAHALSETGMNASLGGASNPTCRNRLIRSNQVLRQAMQISCDPMLYTVMGNNYQAMEESAKAEDAFTKATQLFPNCP